MLAKFEMRGETWYGDKVGDKLSMLANTITITLHRAKMRLNECFVAIKMTRGFVHQPLKENRERGASENRYMQQRSDNITSFSNG